MRVQDAKKMPWQLSKLELKTGDALSRPEMASIDELVVAEAGDEIGSASETRV